MRRQLSAWICAIVLAAVAFAPGSATAGMTTCRLTYAIKGWSFVYKTYRGTGTVRCENGQSAAVTIRTHGGGATIGKSEVRGKGRFSEVRGIGETYGSYAEANAHAGATKSAESRVLTKGEVSLSLSGTGRGMDVGVALGAFTIQPR